MLLHNNTSLCIAYKCSFYNENGEPEAKNTLVKIDAHVNYYGSICIFSRLFLTKLNKKYRLLETNKGELFLLTLVSSSYHHFKVIRF